MALTPKNIALVALISLVAVYAARKVGPVNAVVFG